MTYPRNKKVLPEWLITGTTRRERIKRGNYSSSCARDQWWWRKRFSRSTSKLIFYRWLTTECQMCESVWPRHYGTISWRRSVAHSFTIKSSMKQCMYLSKMKVTRFNTWLMISRRTQPIKSTKSHLKTSSPNWMTWDQMAVRVTMTAWIVKTNRKLKWKFADITARMKLIMDQFSDRSELHKPKSYKQRKKPKD